MNRALQAMQRLPSHERTPEMLDLAQASGELATLRALAPEVMADEPSQAALFKASRRRHSTAPPPPAPTPANYSASRPCHACLQFRVALLGAFNLCRGSLGIFVPPDELMRPIAAAIDKGFEAAGEDVLGADAPAAVAQELFGVLVSCCIMPVPPDGALPAEAHASGVIRSAAFCRQQLWPDPLAMRAQLAARDWVAAMPPAGASASGSGSGSSSGGRSSSGGGAAAALAALLQQHRPELSVQALRLECLQACSEGLCHAVELVQLEGVGDPAWQEALQQGLLDCQLLLDALPQDPAPYLAAARLLVCARWLPRVRRTAAAVPMAIQGAKLAEREQRELSALASE